MRWSPSSMADRSSGRGGAGAGRLVIVCGLPGAGKTTRARAIEDAYPGVRFCPDEWMASLAIDLWDAAPVSESNDCGGTWRRMSSATAARRSSSGERGHGWSVTRCGKPPVDSAPDVLWRRIQNRGMESTFASRPITEEDVAAFVAAFEPPDAAELDLYDQPLLTVVDPDR